MSINKELLGKSIRQIRELRGLSQVALASSVGLQGNSVALIERGKRGVSLETLNALADALGVPAACLAMLGAEKIAGDGRTSALVSSMQKLIKAAIGAQARLQAKEEVEAAQSHQMKEAMDSIPKIESLLKSLKTSRTSKKPVRVKAKRTRKGTRDLEHA